MSFGQRIEYILKLELNVKYLLCLYFLTGAKFYNLGTFKGVHFNSKEMIFSDFHVGQNNQNKHPTLNSCRISNEKYE